MPQLIVLDENGDELQRRHVNAADGCRVRVQLASAHVAVDLGWHFLEYLKLAQGSVYQAHDVAAHTYVKFGAAYQDRVKLIVQIFPD